MTELTENSKPAAARVGECGSNTDSGVVTSPELLLHPLRFNATRFVKESLAKEALPERGADTLLIWCQQEPNLPEAPPTHLLLCRLANKTKLFA